MDNPSYFSKRMFGGLSIYYEDLMVLVLMESPEDREWRGTKYSFDLWNGVMICTDRERHPELHESFKGLISHPVLGKWLYLPMSDLAFESTFSALVEAIADNSPLIGIAPGTRSRKKAKSKARKKKTPALKAKDIKKPPAKKSSVRKTKTTNKPKKKKRT
ncbi:MAG: hypothetical protein H6624_02440 [Bdellovibrionaceae bacterium]|nr:hypothetical protein [Pseudobdellovibrionaceae bacterium]